jgi:hypothetical protein
VLTVTQLRQYVTTALEESALQGLLTAAYQAIDPRLPSGPQSELLTTEASTLVLSLPAASITSIVDRGDTLDPDDYQVISPTMLRRLHTGPNPARIWYRPFVTYLPMASEAERDRMAVALVKLDLTHKPGLTGFRIGEYQESFATGEGSDYAASREAILSSYGRSEGAFV